MNIIIGKEAAEKLKENYTVLELETFIKNDKSITAYCVVDQIPLAELPILEELKKKHSDFVFNYNNKNYKECKSLIPDLQGKFNGDVDSFYQIILERINQQEKLA